MKLIRMKRQFKFTPNSQKLKFRQISYTLNVIHLQYIFYIKIKKLCSSDIHFTTGIVRCKCKVPITFTVCVPYRIVCVFYKDIFILS